MTPSSNSQFIEQMDDNEGSTGNSEEKDGLIKVLSEDENKEINSMALFTHKVFEEDAGRIGDEIIIRDTVEDEPHSGNSMIPKRKIKQSTALELMNSFDIHDGSSWLEEIPPSDEFAIFEDDIQLNSPNIAPTEASERQALSDITDQVFPLQVPESEHVEMAFTTPNDVELKTCEPKKTPASKFKWLLKLKSADPRPVNALNVSETSYYENIKRQLSKARVWNSFKENKENETTELHPVISSFNVAEFWRNWGKPSEDEPTGDSPKLRIKEFKENIQREGAKLRKIQKELNESSTRSMENLKSKFDTLKQEYHYKRALKKEEGEHSPLREIKSLFNRTNLYSAVTAEIDSGNLKVVDNKLKLHKESENVEDTSLDSICKNENMQKTEVLKRMQDGTIKTRTTY